MAHTGKRERSGTATKAPPANRGGRYGLLLLLLIGTYLLAAFSGAKLATEVQVLLFAFVLLIALRNSPLPAPWPLVIGAATVIGTAVTFLASLSGSPNGKAAEDLWKALILLMAVIMVVRRVLAKRTVTIQSIYGALSAYIIIGLMFASSFAAINYLSTSDFFARQRARQYPDVPVLQFHHADHPRVRGLHRGGERQPFHRGPGGADRPDIPGHPGGSSCRRVPDPGPA